jgi:endoglucanase Acf2
MAEAMGHALHSGFTNGVTANYNTAWGKGGPYENDTNLLMFGLPHHLESFDSTTKTLGSQVNTDADKMLRLQPLQNP